MKELIKENFAFLYSLKNMSYVNSIRYWVIWKENVRIIVHANSKIEMWLVSFNRFNKMVSINNKEFPYVLVKRSRVIFEVHLRL